MLRINVRVFIYRLGSRLFSKDSWVLEPENSHVRIERDIFFFCRECMRVQWWCEIVSPRVSSSAELSASKFGFKKKREEDVSIVAVSGLQSDTNGSSNDNTNKWLVEVKNAPICCCSTHPCEKPSFSRKYVSRPTRTNDFPLLKNSREGGGGLKELKHKRKIPSAAESLATSFSSTRLFC